MTLRWPRPAITIIALTVLALVGFIAWSLWADLDQITRARGQVIPAGRVQVLQSPDGGVIERILVREGDRVKKGQLLMQLDQVKLAAGADEAKAKVASLESTMARLQAELFNRPLVFPESVRAFPEFMANQRLLYAKRRQALQADIATLQRQLGLAREEIGMNAPLLKTGDISRADLIRMERDRTQIQGEIDSRRNRYLEDLQTEYTKTQEDLASEREVLTQRGDLLSASEVRAPADGIVKNVRLTTVGGVLRPGDEIMEIVPTADTLIVEAKVAPKDIAFLRPGEGASVKFDAYDSSIYGAGEGRVTYISADTLTERGEDGREAPFYRVHVAVDTKRMRSPNAGERIEIQPGMTATVEIRTGSTTVFHYLTKPILRTTSESMGER